MFILYDSTFGRKSTSIHRLKRSYWIRSSIRGYINKLVIFSILRFITWEETPITIIRSQILCKRYLFSGWQALTAEKCGKFGENGKKWITWIHQAPFVGPKRSLKPRILRGRCTVSYNSKTFFCLNQLWSLEHEWQWKDSQLRSLYP